ncbi:MAG: MFS transporter [Firmicutes bacterium]|nr:MFS transporter [Bacillota bacterium]
MSQEASLKRYTLLVAAMASFLTPFMGSAVNLAIPSIGHQFSSSAYLLSWVATSYILAAAAFLVPIGRLADIVGRKKVFIAGISFFALASVLCGLAWSVEALIVFRAVQGIASAMIFGTSMAILTSVFPPQERGKVLGITVASVYIGLSLGPVLGGFLNHNLGWQSIFYFTALIAVLAVLFTLARLKGEWAGAQGEKYDFGGAALYAVGLVALMYGVSSVTASHWAKYSLLLGLVMLVLFIRHQLKVEHPLLHLKLFSKNATFAFSNLAAFINYSATFGVAFLLSLYLQVVLGFNSQTAGFMLLSQPVLMALLSPFAGTLSDRIQPRVVASLGMAVTALALFIFCFLSMQTPLWLVVANLALLGSGLALFSSPNTNAVMGSVEKKFLGVASSTIGTMRLTGQAVSMAVVTLILALYVGNVELSQAPADMLVKGTRTSMLVFAATCIGGVFASLARGNMRKQGDGSFASKG